jgi:hypothetical protein
LRFSGLRVALYPDDHRPAHVHVIGPAAEAVFNLNCPKGSSNHRAGYKFTMPALRATEIALNQAISKLCKDWEKFHDAD